MLGTEVATPDPIDSDLRTVLSLLTGVRVSSRVCRRWIDEVFDGRCQARHEAIVYLLATHFLALGDRPGLDNLAWRWMQARQPHRGWSVRLSADALRLAVFAAESGWSRDAIARLTTIIAQSRSTPLWISLTDLARVGGRRADRLLPVVQDVDVSVPDHHSRRAAFLMLSAVHELQHLHAEVGSDFVVVTNAAMDCRTATLFTDDPAVSSDARRAIYRARETHGLLTALHSHYGGAELLCHFDENHVVVPINGHRHTYPEDHLSAVAHVHEATPFANHPVLFDLNVDRVLSVFPSGREVANSARFWVLDSPTPQGRSLYE